MMRRIVAALLFVALMALAHQSYAAESDNYCVAPVASGSQWQPCSSSNPLAISGSFTATLSGFTPNGSYGTPLSVSTSTAQTSLPSGTVVFVQNVGSTLAYVNLGTSSSVTATTSDIAVPAGGGCSLTVGSNTNIAAITASSTTTLNLVGGSGLGSACYSGTGGTITNQSVNLAQVNGVTTLTGAGATGTGSQRETVAQDTTTIAGSAPGTAGTASANVVSVQGVTNGTGLGVNDSLVNNAPATANITVQDAASTTSTGANGQIFIAGTPTAGSAATFALSNGYGTMRVQVTGTWTGTLVNEVSMDGGTTWVAKGLHQIGTPYTTSAYTGNFSGEGAIAGVTNVRVRATATWTGTATIRVITTVVDEQVYVGNPIQFPVAMTPTDCSGSISTGGTAQNAITAQTTLHGFQFMNLSTDPMWISFTGTAALTTAGSYFLVAASSTVPGGSYSTPPGFGTNHALSVIAATTSDKFSCTWW
jgi:hypothetical protein